MEKLKQAICGLMACLMLADPVSMCSTVYANENEPTETEAILQMEPVEQEGTSLLQDVEQQQTAQLEENDPEQAVSNTGDTSAPTIDPDSLRLEKTKISPRESNTLYVSVTDDSEITEMSIRFVNEATQELCTGYSFSKTEDGQYALPITVDGSLGKWQLFTISATDAFGNAATYLNSAYSEEARWFGANTLCDFSAIAFELTMDSFATPKIDLESLSIDKRIDESVSSIREAVVITADVENPNSVRQFSIHYRVTTASGNSTDYIDLGYSADLGKFRVGWYYPSYFGKYEAERIDLLDHSGEWQTIYNSALTYNWTLPEEAVMYDLSALNFDSVDAQIYTMESLKAALAEAQDNDHLQIAASEDFVINEDITIPKGVYLDIPSGSGSFKIAEGVTFTTESEFNCDVPMTVEGTWLSQSADVNDLTIAEGGLVENNGDLMIRGAFENSGTLTNSAGATTRHYLNAENAAELKTALPCENPGEKEINLYVSGAVTLTEDIVIPENTRLYVYDSTGNGTVSLTVGEGATLTTQGGYWCVECHVPLTVAGKLVNETGGIKLTKGLTITSTGSVDSTGGSIHLTGEFVNDGVLVKGSNVYQTLTVGSMDELRSALQGVVSGGTVKIKTDSEFAISDDITIPKGITVEVYEGVQKLRLEVGAKLTIDTGATLRSYTPVEVDGTVYNYGSIGARCGITVNGTIHNYDYIRVEGGEFVGAEKVTSYVTGVCSVHKEYAVDSEESLRTTLDALDLSAWNTLTAAEGFSLTDDITIPQGVYLDIQSGTFKVPEKVVLTTCSNLDVKDMAVDGQWINNMNKAGYGFSTVSGNFEASGTVKNSGWIQLVQYSKDAVTGIENIGEGYVTYGRGNNITSLEELRKEIDSAAGSCDYIYWDMDADTLLDGDLEIPEGILLYIGGDHTLTIPENMTLRVAESARLDFNGSVNVQGVLHSEGNCLFEQIEISGQLENMGGFSFDNMLITSTGKVEDAGVMIGTVDNQGEMRIVTRTGGSKTFYVGLGVPCDWKDAFRNVQSGDSVEFIYWTDDYYITGSEDATLPEGVSINGGNFAVSKGATLTTNGTIFASNMNIEGTWVNNGSADVDRLTANGSVRNNASITAGKVSGTLNITGKPVIVGNGSDGITPTISTTVLDLQDVLNSAPKGATVICQNYHQYGENPITIINEDITIPAGITVELVGVSKAYLTSGHTLTVDGTLIAAQPLYVAGSLVINGEVSISAMDEGDAESLQYLGVTMGGINIVDDGFCDVNGSIRVGKTDYNGQTIADPSAVFSGIDISDLTQRETEECWYLTKKVDEGKSEIFCELPETGCRLQLIGADGTTKELAPAGSGAVITDITPGRYTLEVSKPGYVTHSISIDTAEMSNTLKVELVKIGNINGAASDGIDVDIVDMQCLYTLLSTDRYDGDIKDKEYMKTVADVNGDDSVDILDYHALYVMVKQS